MTIQNSAKAKGMTVTEEEGEFRGMPFHIINIDPGRQVFCDFCDTDYTDSEATGGFLFQSKAVCPNCSKESLSRIKGYGEEHFIRGYCPDGMSFSDWIRSLR